MNCSKKVQLRLSDSVGYINVKINLKEFQIVSNFSDEIFDSCSIYKLKLIREINLFKYLTLKKWLML
jgi:hypothetical protein